MPPLRPGAWHAYAVPAMTPPVPRCASCAAGCTHTTCSGCLVSVLAAMLHAGLAFGAHWSLAAALASEWFGLRSFASNYCLLQVWCLRGGKTLRQLAGSSVLHGVRTHKCCQLWCMERVWCPSHMHERAMLLTGLPKVDLRRARKCDALQLAPALGGYMLATQLAGVLYNREAERQGRTHRCAGSACFRCCRPYASA